MYSCSSHFSHALAKGGFVHLCDAFLQTKLNIVLLVFRRGVLGQDTSKPEPRAGNIRDIHEFVSCRRDMTENIDRGTIQSITSTL